jgi:site-specific DNA-methyltransferase (adenine-specific)
MEKEEGRGARKRIMGMRAEHIGDAALYLGAMEETIGGIEHFDHILTDPPYLYLKQDFDRPWDEKLLFESAKSKLPDHGFIALFGRGTSFYRWNTMLAELGFKFKEEIIWEKATMSSFLGRLMRVHETIAVYSKKDGTINKCRIDYVEHKQHDVEGIIEDVKRIRSLFRSKEGSKEALEYLESGIVKFRGGKHLHCVVARPGLKRAQSRGTYTLRAIMEGLVEKSIIKIPTVHLGSLHPTQKPVRLAERLLALISNPGDTIYDPFMGIGSFGVACINTGRRYIGSEMKPEYFDIACKRIKEAYKQGELFKKAG